MASVNKSKLAESAQKLLAKGQIDKALKEYERILRGDPGDASTRLKVGDLKLRLGQKDPAILDYRRVADKFTEEGFYSKAVAVLKRVIAVEPHLLEAHLELASLNQKLSLLSEVVHHYQIAANIHDRRGEKREAIDILKKVADVGPPNLERKIKVAELYYREGLKDSGFEQFEAAAKEIDPQSGELVAITRRMWKACPEDVRLGRRLAELSLARGDAKSAVEAIEEACGRVRDPELIELLADAKAALDLTGEAKSLFEEAAKLYRTRGNAARSQELQARAVEIASAAIDALASAADLLAAAPPLAPVEPLIAEERPAQPFSPAQMSEDQHLEAALSEADVYQKYGKHDRAVTTLEDLATRYPHRHEAPLRLREIFETCGDWTSVAIQCRRLARVAEGRADADRAARFEEQALEAELRAKGGLPDAVPGEAQADFEAIGPEQPAPEPVTLDATPAAEVEPLLSADAQDIGPGSLGDIELVIEGAEGPASPAPAEPAGDFAPDELQISLDEEPASHADVLPFPAVVAPRRDEPDLMLDDAFDEAPAAAAVEARYAGEQAAGGGVADLLGEIVIDLDPTPEEPRAEPTRTRTRSVEEDLLLEELSAEGASRHRAEEIVSPAEMPEPEPIPDLGEPIASEEPAPLNPESSNLGFGEAEDRAVESPFDPEEEIVLLDTPTDEETEGGSLDSWNESLLAEGAPASAGNPADAEAGTAPDLELDLPLEEPEQAADPSPPSLAWDRPAAAGESDFDLRAELDLDGSPHDAVAHATEELSHLVSELQLQEESVPSPEDAQTHYDLGIAYKEMGLLDDAIREMKIAARDPGRRVECLAVLGICYCQQGKPEEALGMFEQCLALGGSTGKGAAGILYEMALVHEEAGTAAQALECYQRVAEIDPDYRETRARVARLGSAVPDAAGGSSRPGRNKKISYL